MEFQWLNITYAHEWYEQIWEDIPEEEPPVTSDHEQTSEQPANPTENFGIMVIDAPEPTTD